MVYLHTEIEIAAPPEKVRAVLLDFPQTSTWLSGPGITSISIKPHPTDPSLTKSDPYTLAPGDILINELNKSTKFEPVILVNDASELKWRGSIPYIFTGEHSFQFRKSEVNEGGTTFVNEENFSGALGWLMSSWAMGGSTRGSFEGLCRDLKGRVESLEEGERAKL
ncbi:hypothetical protein CKM354_000982300 [Cercospora kikuchii]|uniref:Uncharacterized protein n=1 Tax=Cercospora kikuchii TaxID=84275 RepID=A0A9P3FK94_9PEZI|nr:uncharacterized protein CKM354_000982300 [Cercospora kikuchii]GIZ46709.1 hypothetical protein CKM354_000982300 [Cercospora kikuchii]